jgi:hypothetical protein
MSLSDQSESVRRALYAARDALHEYCLDRGSTDGYWITFDAINSALTKLAFDEEGER